MAHTSEIQEILTAVKNVISKRETHTSQNYLPQKQQVSSKSELNKKFYFFP